MKFIFKSDINRVPRLKAIKITGACRFATVESPHANHLQKGGVFEFGPWQNEKELQKAEASPEKTLIATLRVCGAIGDAADPEVVARVERELAEQQTREASVARANDRTKKNALQNAFMQMIEKAAALQAQ